MSGSASFQKPKKSWYAGPPPQPARGLLTIILHQMQEMRVRSQGCEVGAGIECCKIMKSQLECFLERAKAVVFQCTKCNARISLPPDDLKLPQYCVCGKVEFGRVPKGEHYRLSPFSEFCLALRDSRVLLRNTAAPFLILLEFNAEDFESKSDEKG